MSISSNDVIIGFNNSNSLDRDPRIRKQIDDTVRLQRKAERQILDSQQSCPIKRMEKHLSSLDVKKLASTTASQFYNHEVMELTSCTLQAISKPEFYSRVHSDLGQNYLSRLSGGKYYQDMDHMGGGGDLELMNRMNAWFTDEKQIGAESVDGVAMAASLRGNPIGVIKVPRDPGNQDFVHEMMVGMRGTNLTRKDIKNFAYVYTGFQCPGAVVNPDTREVVSICSNQWGDNVQYIVYENIYPSVSLSDYAKKCTPGEYFSAMVQILLATEYAHRLIDWTHYDLHDENVLMRSVDLPVKSGRSSKDFYLSYPIGKTTYKVKADKIATIIDYGRSHIKYKGQHYGYGFVGAATYPDESFPLFDIYKLLMFSSGKLNQADGELRRVANAFFSYFNNREDIFEAEGRQHSTYYQLPKTEVTKKMSVMGLFAHLKQKLPTYFRDYILENSFESLPAPTVSCSDLMCTTRSKFEKDVNISSNSPLRASNIYFYFDQKAILIEQGDESALDELYQNFQKDYHAEMRNHVRQVNRVARDYNSLALEIGDPFAPSKILNSRIIQKMGSEILNKSNMSRIQKTVSDILALRDLDQKMNTLVVAGIDVAEDFGEVDLVWKFNQNFAALAKNQQRVYSLLYLLGRASYLLVQIAESLSSGGNRSLRKNRNWYLQVLPSMVNLIDPKMSYSDFLNAIDVRA